MIFHLVMKVFELILLQLKMNFRAKNGRLGVNNLFNPLSDLKIVGNLTILRVDHFHLNLETMVPQHWNLCVIVP